MCYNRNIFTEMATGNVINISSSSSDSDADDAPLRRRMSERKRRLSDKAKQKEVRKYYTVSHLVNLSI